MRYLHLLLLFALTLQPVQLSAQVKDPSTAPTRIQLRGLDAEEAADLIVKLQDAQAKLQVGKFQSFELLSRSIASYDATKTSPRDVFLEVPFDEVWDIEKVPAETRLWQPFNLAYAPNGLGKLYWEIEVVLGFSGGLERVTMTYKPPAPF